MTGYLYDGDCVVAEFDARGKVMAQYIHGPGLGADVGSLICAQTLGDDGAASERYYSHNWRGDTIGITDESGASLARYRYGAFGELIAGDGGIANNILFSGKRYDSALGLYYFGARYYDASSGRFISRDPMGYIDGPNEYVLAMNNPLLWIDPYGLWKRQAWNTVVDAIDYVSGVSSVNAMEIVDFGFNNPIGTVDYIPGYELPTKSVTPITDSQPVIEINPHNGPQSPSHNITINTGLQSPTHNTTPKFQYDSGYGILKKAVTPPPDENAKGEHNILFVCP